MTPPTTDSLTRAAEYLFGVRPDRLHLERTDTSRHLVALTAQGTPIPPRMQAVADLTAQDTYHVEGTPVPLRDEAAYAEVVRRNPWLRDVLSDDLLSLSPAAGALRLAVPDAGAVQIQLPSAALNVARHLGVAALTRSTGPFWAHMLSDPLLRVFLRTLRPANFDLLRRAARGEDTGECGPLVPGMLREVNATLLDEFQALVPGDFPGDRTRLTEELTRTWILGLTHEEYAGLHASESPLSQTPPMNAPAHADSTSRATPAPRGGALRS